MKSNLSDLCDELNSIPQLLEEKIQRQQHDYHKYGQQPVLNHSQVQKGGDTRSEEHTSEL